MLVKELLGVEQEQPKRKIETRKDGAGNPINCVFEDRDGDGKLDLYQITKIKPSYDGCKHEITYTDNDGDGYFDFVQEKVTCNMTSNGKRLSENDRTITEEYTEKSEATRMENILNPVKNIQKRELKVPIHFDIDW